jgi:hypothetical protein
MYVMQVFSLQVQFRLRQIVDAPLHEKETLLKDLEEFAFRGIPDVRDPKINSHICSTDPPVSFMHNYNSFLHELGEVYLEDMMKCNCSTH